MVWSGFEEKKTSLALVINFRLLCFKIIVYIFSASEWISYFGHYLTFRIASFIIILVNTYKVPKLNPIAIFGLALHTLEGLFLFCSIPPLEPSGIFFIIRTQVSLTADCCGVCCPLPSGEGEDCPYAMVWSGSEIPYSRVLSPSWTIKKWNSFHEKIKKIIIC